MLSLYPLGGMVLLGAVTLAPYPRGGMVFWAAVTGVPERGAVFWGAETGVPDRGAVFCGAVTDTGAVLPGLRTERRGAVRPAAAAVICWFVLQ